MPAEIRAILLIPSPEHRAALLAEGPCDDGPPWVWFGTCRHCGPVTGLMERRDGRLYRQALCVRDEHDCVTLNDRSQALVLAWEGVVVPEGCDRAWRYRNARTPLEFRVDPYAIYTMKNAEWLASECKEFGTVEVLRGS